MLFLKAFLKCVFDSTGQNKDYFNILKFYSIKIRSKAFDSLEPSSGDKQIKSKSKLTKSKSTSIYFFKIKKQIF